MALGYKKPENAIAVHVEDEDKTSTLNQGSGSNYKSKTTFINESGLYALILSAKLESARRFNDIRPKNGFLYELYAFVERMFVDNKRPITECYIDHRRGYIHIAYDAEDSNTWPFIAK